MKVSASIQKLPGGEMILSGLLDRQAGRDTINACLVDVVAPHLTRHGFDVSGNDDYSRQTLPEHQLYRMLQQAGHEDPYGQYNSILRTMASFGRALDQQNPGN